MRPRLALELAALVQYEEFFIFGSQDLFIFKKKANEARNFTSNAMAPTSSEQSSPRTNRKLFKDD